MDSQPERPDTEHPYPSYTDLQAESARLRDQLDTVMTALTPIEVGVRLIRQKFEQRVQGGEQS
jgi:hypothetical protein